MNKWSRMARVLDAGEKKTSLKRASDIGGGVDIVTILLHATRLDALGVIKVPVKILAQQFKIRSISPRRVQRR